MHQNHKYSTSALLLESKL